MEHKTFPVLHGMHSNATAMYLGVVRSAERKMAVICEKAGHLHNKATQKGSKYARLALTPTGTKLAERWHLFRMININRRYTCNIMLVQVPKHKLGNGVIYL